MKDQFDIVWLDAKKEPSCAPNPAYPLGVELDVSAGVSPTCTVPLPYPAKRIGSYLVRCKLCGIQVACTTAGRPDDPRSIKIPCKTQ